MMKPGGQLYALLLGAKHWLIIYSRSLYGEATVFTRRGKEKSSASSCLSQYVIEFMDVITYDGKVLVF
jgi:hypothetical protein